MLTIDFIVPLYIEKTPVRQMLLDRAIYSMTHQAPIKDVQYRTVAVYSPQTTKESLKKVEGFDEVVEFPHDELKTSGKHEFCYNNSKADYVAFCQNDDEWFLQKTATQLIPNAAFMASGFNVINAGRFEHYDEPHIEHDGRIMTVLPSTWIMNKHIIKKFPLSAKLDFEWDVITTDIIHCKFPIHICKIPLVNYNIHGDNSSSISARDITPAEGRKTFDLMSKDINPVIYYRPWWLQQ